MSVNVCESTIGMDFEVSNKIEHVGKFTNMESVNNEEGECM